MSACQVCQTETAWGVDECRDCARRRSADNAARRMEQQASEAVRAQRVAEIPVVTVPTLPGYRIVGHSGAVSAEAVYGMHLLRDFASSATDTFGGRSKSIEAYLARARGDCLEKLRSEADALGANAVVGVDMNQEIVTPGNSSSKLIMVAALGTAVVALPE